jgi:hypothetical protein
MPHEKDLKRLTRARMAKTGESYTTARGQLLAKRARLTVAPPAKATKPPARDLAKVAGMSDAAIAKNTGHGWAEWVGILDARGSATKSHRDIAEHVHEAHGVPGWWAQAVTVGYERIKGLRDVGQRRDGNYEASKSKTFGVPVAELWRSFAEPRRRKRWLPELKLRVTSATAPRSMRMALEDGTRVSLWFTDKGTKSAVSVQHLKLPTKAEATKQKAFWGERLRALGELLG